MGKGQENLFGSWKEDGIGNSVGQRSHVCVCWGDIKSQPQGIQGAGRKKMEDFKEMFGVFGLEMEIIMHRKMLNRR